MAIIGAITISLNRITVSPHDGEAQSFWSWRNRSAVTKGSLVDILLNCNSVAGEFELLKRPRLNVDEVRTLGHVNQLQD